MNTNKLTQYQFIGIILIILLVGILAGHFIFPKKTIKEEIQIEDILGKELPIRKPLANKITRSDYYSLDCETFYYTDITIGGELIKDSYIKISEGHEKAVLYIDGKTAKYFGADYTVLLDNSSYLVIMRTYGFSGLTEVVSINKDSGIGMDTKTLTFGASGQPISDTYILSCSEI